jgi:hypothetical protein
LEIGTDTEKKSNPFYFSLLETIADGGRILDIRRIPSLPVIVLLCVIFPVFISYVAHISIILHILYAQAYLQTQEENDATA